MSRRASSAARSISPVTRSNSFDDTSRALSPARQRVKRHTSGSSLLVGGASASPRNGLDMMMDSSNSSFHKSIPSDSHHMSGKRRKTTFQGTSYWVVFLTAMTLHASIMISNFVVFDILGGERDIQFASLLWGIMNTAIACMNLSILRSCAIPILARLTSNTQEATRMLFDDTLAQPMSRLWIGLVVGVCFTYAATGFDLPPWTQLRFSATSYTVSVAWSFSLLSTFAMLSSGE